MTKISEKQLKSKNEITIQFNKDVESAQLTKKGKKPVISIPLDDNSSFKKKKFLQIQTNIYFDMNTDWKHSDHVHVVDLDMYEANEQISLDQNSYDTKKIDVKDLTVPITILIPSKKIKDNKLTCSFFDEDKSIWT